MKFALLTVSYSGQFYLGEALSLEQQIHKARELGFDGLSIETKRPVASPLDLSRVDRERIKALAADEGIALCAVESMSNFAGRCMEERENNLAMMKMVLELARDLNVDLVKVFAAWPGIINDEEEIALYAPYEKGYYYKKLYPADLRRWHHAVDGIREVADWAADLGITLALQNHAPVLTPGYEDLLSMTQEIDRKNVKLCLDVPLFQERQSDEYVREAVRKCGPLNVLSHFGAWNFSENEDGEVVQDPAPSFGGKTNYRTFIEELQKADYAGYLVSECCLPVLKNHRIGGIGEVDYLTRISLKYMKDLVRETAPVPA
ncbi:sugar phosphate isomerase/epimerase family protein [Larkinella soli]|uniref:sugar phosphate isomerase/epimerase family protein n=1 Tax=Larkinella soli TaxID=1770527 RepID=UPI000FFB82A6|nr:sugar phosphate isomerase/epimerase family protein [Larkinella soli]